MIETVFSVSLIAVVILLVFNLFPTSSMAVQHSKLNLQANAVAQSWLEKARSQSLGNVTTGPLADTQVEGVTFKASQETYQVGTIDVTQLKGVRVTVHWLENNADHQASQEAYLAGLPR